MLRALIVVLCLALVPGAARPSAPASVIDGGGSLGGVGPLDTGGSAPTDFFFSLSFFDAAGGAGLDVTDSDNFELTVMDVSISGSAALQRFGQSGGPVAAFDWTVSGNVGASAGNPFGGLTFAGDTLSFALDALGFPGQHAQVDPFDVAPNFIVLTPVSGGFDIGFGLEGDAVFEINPTSTLTLNGGAGFLVELVVIPLPAATLPMSAALLFALGRRRRARAGH